MAKQVINNGESGATVRGKINDNFTELYDGKVDASGDSMTGNLAMGGNKVTGLGEASGNGDAVRYEQLMEHVDADLTAIAGLSPSNDDIIQRKSGAWTNRTIAQLLTDLGLGDIVTDLSYFSAIGVGSDLTFTNHPNSEQAITSATPGRSTRLFNATSYNYVKLIIHVRTSSASVNNPRLYLNYSTDDITYNLVGTGSGSDICSLSTTGFIETGWITLTSGMKANNYWRVLINGGDGVADPALGSIHVQFKR